MVHSVVDVYKSIGRRRRHYGFTDRRKYFKLEQTVLRARDKSDALFVLLRRPRNRPAAWVHGRFTNVTPKIIFDFTRLFVVHTGFDVTKFRRYHHEFSISARRLA